MTVAMNAAANVIQSEVSTPLSASPAANSPGIEAKIVATSGTRMKSSSSRPANEKTQSIRLSTRIRFIASASVSRRRCRAP